MVVYAPFKNKRKYQRMAAKPVIPAASEKNDTVLGWIKELASKPLNKSGQDKSVIGYIGDTASSIFNPNPSKAPTNARSTSGIFGSLFSTSAATAATATATASAANSANGFQFSRMIAYVFAILSVLLIIVLFVHFFITPIFRLRPGTPGLIPVPGFDDGILYWSTSSVELPNTSLPIRTQFYGYSFHVDLFIENPLAFSATPRLLFHRGGVLKDTPSGETLLGILHRYNLAVALMPDTNDLMVSVLNKQHLMENVIIPNVPVQTPFRLSAVIIEQGMEVYLNGQLVKTRRFTAPPLDITGNIVPIPGLATLRQLKIWGRTLSASEIREATPALTTAKDFNLGPIPSSTSCGDASPSYGDAAASAASAAAAVVDSPTMSSLSAPFFTRLGPGGSS